MSLVRFRFWARRCSSMVEHQPSKLNTWVRFPSPALKMNILFIMREWLSWWSTTLPRSGSRVRVPSRALLNSKNTSASDVFFSLRRLDPARGFGSPFHSGRCYQRSTGPLAPRLASTLLHCRTRTGSYLHFTPVGASKGPLDL